MTDSSSKRPGAAHDALIFLLVIVLSAGLVGGLYLSRVALIRRAPPDSSTMFRRPIFLRRRFARTGPTTGRGNRD